MPAILARLNVGTTRKILVQKFGGTSLASARSLAQACEIIAESHSERGAVIAVVSARGRTTDDLLWLADSVAAERSLRETDQLLATGEVVSAALMAMALQSRGVPTRSMTGAQAGITTTGPHGAGVVARIDTSPLLAAISRGEAVIVAGFQGVNDAGDVVTLGRGGSDTTAIALAAALGASCEIYTDVDGIYTADPRLVPTARLLPEVPGPVMAELSFGGAKVLHSRAAELATLASVDVQVRSSLTRRPGTRISAKAERTLEDRGALMAVTCDRAVARILVRGEV
jgi:aspartate kinase